MSPDKEKELRETLGELNDVLSNLTREEREFADNNEEVRARLDAFRRGAGAPVPAARQVKLACFYPAGAGDIFQKLLKKLHNAAIIITREEWCFETVAGGETCFDPFDGESARGSARSAGAEAMIVISPDVVPLGGDRSLFCRAIPLGHAGSLFHYADLILDLAGHFNVTVAPRVRACDTRENNL